MPMEPSSATLNNEFEKWWAKYIRNHNQYYTTDGTKEVNITLGMVKEAARAAHRSALIGGNENGNNTRNNTEEERRDSITEDEEKG